MLTELGRTLRIMRIKRGMTLGAMADGMRVSSAFLSAIEHGKKNITASQMESLAAFLSLTKEDVISLQEAAHKSKSEHKLSVKDEPVETRELVSMFARSVESKSLTAQQRERIMEILMKK